MKRLFILIAALLLLPLLTQAQTTVNLTVTDTPDNQVWYNGTWAVRLVSGNSGQSLNNPSITSGGGSLSPQSGLLSTTGTASMSLPANANIGPAGTRWQFTVCPGVSAGCFIQNVIVSTSSPQTLNITPPSIRINYQAATPPVLAYTTTEIVGAGLGVQIVQLGPTFGTPAPLFCSVVTSITNCITWSSMGGGGGSNPLGNNGDLQSKNGTNLSASSINDNGSRVLVTNDAHFKGPNPNIDVTAFNVRAVSTVPTTTCTTTGGSANVTIGAASTFQNGDGVVCRAAGANFTLSTPTAPTVTSSNASSLLGTGVTVANASGATTYNYCIVVRDIGGGYSPCSPVGSTTTGATTLGASTVNISSWTRSNTTITVTTASNHNIVAGALVRIVLDNTGINGWYQVISATPGTSTFTFSTGADTRNGAATSATSSTGTVTTFVGNHITWTHVANAWYYLIYAGVGGNLVGVSLIDSTGLNTDPTYNVFDDWGSPITTAPGQPDWVPATAPTVAKNDDLVSTIVSGAGTTSLVLANTATNAVTGATFKFDNTPNIVAAATVAAGNSAQTGVLFFPAATPNTNSFYPTSSVLNLNAVNGFATVLAVQQAGGLNLGDTMVLSQTSWEGSPKNPGSQPQFGWEKLPSIASATATPMIYSFGQQRVRFLSITDSSTNAGIIWLHDGIGQIPSSQWDHVQFSTSGNNDYSSQHLIIRNNIAKDANFNFSFLNFVSGPGTSSFSGVPLFQNTQSMSPASFDHIMMNHRGLFLGTAFGMQISIHDIYCQGCNMPKISMANSPGGVGTPIISLDYAISIEDTSADPTIAYFGSPNGLVRMFGSNGATVSGPGGLPFIYGTIGSTPLQQNKDFENILVTGVATDGILSSTGGQYTEKVLGAGLHTGPAYQQVVEATKQVAPTCAVSAGGTVAVDTYKFEVSPTFPIAGSSNQSEGIVSSPSLSCTTSSGQQTITINWTAVPGAIGYNLYRSTSGSPNSFFSFQCSPPWVSGSNTSYVWSGASVCGLSVPVLAGGGPTSQSVGGMTAPQFKLTATDGSGSYTETTSSLTANRVETKPNISGTTVLSNSVLTNPNHIITTRSDGTINDFGVAPMSVFDSFTRANGTIQAGNPNWTSILGTINIASNVITGGSASTNTAVYTGASFPTDDQTVAVTLTGVTAGGSVFMSVKLRATASGDNGYLCLYASNSGSPVLQLYKVVSGVTTQLGSNVSYTATIGDTLSCNMIGTTLTLYINGVQKLQQTDATFSSGFPGIWMFNQAAGFTMGNFRASYGAVSLNVAQNWNAVQNFVSGIQLNGSTTLTSASGNSARVGQTSGTLTNGNFAKFDANGNIVDSGTAVGIQLSSITAAIGANSINNGDNAQIWNWALTTAAKTAFKFTENTAAVNGAGSQFLAQIGTIAGSTAVPLNLFSSLTGSQTLPTLSITPTWNTSGVVDAALLVNPTNTASGTGSLLADFQLANTSQWKVDKAGNSTQLGTAALGASPPACTPGSSGSLCENEGSAPSAGSNYDTLYADTTQHAITVNNNNTGNMPISRVTCVNVTPVTANANVTTDQNLMACTLSANLLNVVGRTLRVNFAGVYSTAASSTAALTLKIKLCTVSGCGSGTVINLESIGTPALATVSASNKTFNMFDYSTTQTAGASSAYESHGNLTIDLNTTTGQPVATLPDTNVTTVGTIDSTAQLFLQITGAFSIASASNSYTQRQLTVEVLD